MTEALQQKLNQLKELLSGYGQLLVALSGGVDSVFLLTFAYDLWRDDRVAALTAAGPHFAPDEVEYARQLCERLGISHKTIHMEQVLPLIARNPQDRCYLCKKEIFTLLKERAAIAGSVLADGTNLDDLEDYRPGYRALQELEIASPLKDAGLTKEDIRQALQALADGDPAIRDALRLADGTPLWEKPAFACLASRIPYGEPITEEKLRAVYEAEVFLHGLGFKQVRVRHHGDVARIEVEREDLSKFGDPELMAQVDRGVRNCGFRFAALDLAGYGMGRLNESTTGDTEIGSKDGPWREGPAFQENRISKKFSAPEDDGRQTSYGFDDLLEIIARLRAPDGCPWDRKQTHESLKECLTEEAGEVLEAIDNRDDENLCEELGDLLLQSVMHAQIAREEGRFTMEDVIQGVCEKMIRRHPHVFGDEKAADSTESLALWEEIKRQEKAGR